MENEPIATATPGTTRQKRTPPIKPTTEAFTFNWGKREFGIIAKSFEAETPELQANLIQISGVLQLIKLNLSEPAVVISYLVRKQYPQLSEVAILGNLQEGLLGIGLSGIITGDDLPTILTNLAECTAHVPDVNWNTFWDGMFKSIAAPLTQWEKVCVYAPYVYNVLVKGVVK